MKTYQATKEDISNRKWYIVDAEGKTLGRIATGIAAVLRGKHKPVYTPSMDTGDFVIVVNAEKVAVTGKKLIDKIYYRNSGYPGGLKAIPLGKMLEAHPERAITKAVEGMLPNGRLGRDMLQKLKVYAGGSHPHAAQNPEPLK